jgi:brefeldin A-inhibited guanine nucleotide-exchange protein
MVYQVVDLIYTVSQDTLPDAWELVTPPQRGSHASSLTDLAAATAAGAAGGLIRASSPAAAAAATPMQRASPTAASAASSPHQQRVGLGSAANQAAAAAAASSGLRPPYTLREGVGMRRLAKFRVQVAVQLLLVQAASEMYAGQHLYMSVRYQSRRRLVVKCGSNKGQAVCIHANISEHHASSSCSI